jgi:DNA-binding NarL/FixJ family response regulator
MKKMIRIMLVEDHPEYRESIALALGKEADMELISQFGTAEQALRNLQERSGKIPDIVLLDLNLPGMTGLEALPWFKKYASDTNIIILTQSDQEADVLAAISSGADGYLLKGAKRVQLSESIRNVINGGASLDPDVAKFILNSLKTLTPKDRPEVTLSDRELETLVLLSKGYLKKEIADQLGVTPNTVATFTKRIYEKFNVANAPAAISKAYSAGILPADND